MVQYQSTLLCILPELQAPFIYPRRAGLDDRCDRPAPARSVITMSARWPRAG